MQFVFKRTKMLEVKTLKITPCNWQPIKSVRNHVARGKEGHFPVTESFLMNSRKVSKGR